MRILCVLIVIAIASKLGSIIIPMVIEHTNTINQLGGM